MFFSKGIEVISFDVFFVAVCNNVCGVTTTAAAGPSGTVYGEGQAIITTKDGENVSWKGIGVGKPKGQGLAISWRGAKAFQTSSQKHQ
jgi:hypothetical protein